MKAIEGGGVSHVFYKLMLFYKVFIKLQVAFYRFKEFNFFLRYDQSKSDCITGSLWEGETKAAKKRVFH